ncbi:MAG: hypothetical protein Q9227_005329 [Pyrenula ochraceoflavens]
MQRHTRPEDLDLRRPTRSARSSSLSSDGPSVSGKSIRSPPPAIHPEPVYVAASAASHLISVQLDVEDASISSQALILVNGFLDQLLWTILQSARSTQLTALRPAVVRVLQHRLGEKAIEAADEELEEYLGDGKDEELTEFRGGLEPRGDFDLELAWKLARLRCMVYTRLGDMEEEDEDTFIEDQGLDEGGDGPRRFSNHASSCTPAAAIFLTSILETLGESALYFAGQATQRRLAATLSHTGLDSPNEVTALPTFPSRTTVEDVDVQQLRDSPLKRLWRSWRSNVKTPRLSGRQQFSAPFTSHSRKGSLSTTRDSTGLDSLRRPQSNDSTQPSQIPLPMSEDDIREIEIPGLAVAKERVRAESDGVSSDKPRPRSMVIIPAAITPPTPTHSDGYTSFPLHRSNTRRPGLPHTRSHSLPTPNVSPFPSPPATGLTKFTSMESRDPMDDVSPVEETPPTPHRVSPFSALDQERINAAMAGTIPSVGYVDAMTASHVLEASDHPEATPEDIIDELAEEQRLSTALAEERARAAPPIFMGQERRAPAQINTRGKHSPGRPSPIYAEMQSPDQPFDESMLLANRQAYPSNSQPFANNRSAQLHTEPAHARNSPDEYYTPDSAKSERRSPLTDARRAQVDHSQDLGASRPAHGNPQYENPYNPAAVHMPQNARDARYDGNKSHQSKQSESAASKSSYHSKQASSSSSRAGIVPPGSERAAVQRVEAPFHAREPSANRSNRSTSTSSSKEKRPTTGSTPISRRRAPTGTRPSVDDGPRGSNTSIKEIDDKKQSLEMLIQSDETLHYTLTPHNMRQMESPDSPRRAARNDTADLADFLKNTGPPGNSPQSNRSMPPVKGINGLRSHPPDTTVPLPSPLPESSSPTYATRDRSFSTSTSKSKVAGAGPREAKVSDARAIQDMRDFADFAKSTGPSGPEELPRSIHSRVPKSRMSNDTQRAPSSPIMPTGPRKSSMQSTQRPGSNMSNQTKKTIFRLQARAPTVPAGEQSDLIDFIREGPPRNGGDHRIPRTVAPFRTTMDSDDMQPIKSPVYKDNNSNIPRSSIASTQDSSMVDKSMHSSYNSRTGLLDSTERATTRSNGATSKPLPSFANSEDPFKPKRKQRRVRDPYAIDTDSEEEAEPEEPEEESLADFLKNSAPPPRGASPAPLTSQLNKPIQQVSSSPKMRDRLLRKTSLSGFGQRSTSYGNGVPRNDERPSPPPPYGAASGRADSSYLSQNGSRPDAYESTEASYAARADRSRPHQNVPGPIRQGGPHTATSDLADFLRNTAPPPSTTQTYAPSPTKEESGLAKFFSRRKRVAT